MAGLTLRDVRKSYGAPQVMHGVDLDIQGPYPLVRAFLTSQCLLLAV